MYDFFHTAIILLVVIVLWVAAFKSMDAKKEGKYMLAIWWLLLSVSAQLGLAADRIIALLIEIAKQ